MNKKKLIFIFTKKNKDDPNFISYDTKIEAMCKIVDDKKELIENHQNLFRKYINVVKQQMESNIFPKSFKAMKLALVLPTKFFLEEKNHLLRVLKQHSKNIFLKDLLGMFNALNSNTVHENFPDYEEIINELRIISENSEKKMGFNFSHFLQISTAVFKMPKTQMIQKFIDNLIHVIIYLILIKSFFSRKYVYLYKNEKFILIQ